jgi:hypothetical protein
MNIFITIENYTKPLFIAEWGGRIFYIYGVHTYKNFQICGVIAGWRRVIFKADRGRNGNFIDY